MANTIQWYRTPVDRHVLRGLTKKSDALGLLQTVGFLLFVGATGFAAAYSIGRVHVVFVLLLFFVHGTFYAFILNGFHELSHNTVFKSKALNGFFLRLFSFLSWNNYVFFDYSHTAHHRVTLHPPEDLEVVLPMKFSLKGFLERSIVNPIGLAETLVGTVRLSFGDFGGPMPAGFHPFSAEWKARLFPPENKEGRRKLANWARFTLIGHILIAVASIVSGLWMIPLVVSLAPFYGSWLLYFLNNTQHMGMMDNVPDFRLCARTIHLNPFLRFVYWHMNYHCEHHMYAAIPCYNLKKAHEVMRHDLPKSPRGLIGTWRQIFAIERRQKEDPDYQFNALTDFV